VKDVNRVESLRNVQTLLEMPASQQMDDLFHCGDYKERLETIGFLLWLLAHMMNDNLIEGAKSDTNELCSHLLVVADKCRTQSIEDFARGYVSCRRILDDIPGAANCKSTEQVLENDVARIAQIVGNLNGTDWRSATSKLEVFVTGGWKHLEEVIKVEECPDIENSDTKWKFSKAGTGITNFFGKKGKTISSVQKKSDSVAESIKRSMFSVDVIHEIEKQLPLVGIQGRYSSVVGNMKLLSSQMQDGLTRFEGQKNVTLTARNQEWQDGIVCILLQ
jgi:hypothetical protein